MSEQLPEIPNQVADLFREEELENMRNLDGWAVGTVVRRAIDGDMVHETTIEDAWIELFNGDGEAGRFGGVKFVATQNGSFRESYAYATNGSAKGNEPCWYVEQFEHPSDPDYGRPSPR